MREQITPFAEGRQKLTVKELKLSFVCVENLCKPELQAGGDKFPLKSEGYRKSRLLT